MSHSTLHLIRRQSAVALSAVLLAAAAPQRDPAAVPDRPPNYVEFLPGAGVSFAMVGVPGGTFRMGSPVTESGRGVDEGPQHPVRVRPFWMGRCEVTWDEWDLYAQRRPPQPGDPPPAGADAVTRPTGPYIDETFGFGRHRYPVIGVTHHAALEYCRWLSLRTGRTYRLPTEAEWEYAARAGSPGAYSFGDDPAGLDACAWYDRNSEESTHPVGTKRPNAWGLHDLAGNVAEFCLDHYRADLFAARPRDRLTVAPVVAPTARRFPHVVRGGSWADPAARCRSAARRASDKRWQRSDPQVPQSIWWLCDADFVGFRVVRPVEEQAELRGLRSQVTKTSP